MVEGTTIVPLMPSRAQANATPWPWFPALAQTTLMGRVLEGAAVPAADWLAALASSLVLAALALGYVVRRLRRAAVQ